MLTSNEIEQILAEIEYKPGWKMALRHFDHLQGPTLCIFALVENSYQPKERIELRIYSQIPPMSDQSSFEQWLSWRLSQIEVHESMEWLRKGGKPLFDPHAEPPTDREGL